MDVFNALDLMENDQFLKELKFGIGDGKLQVRVRDALGLVFICLLGVSAAGQ